MLPSLYPGDFVIGTRVYVCVSAKDLILVDHPNYGRIIKRVAKVSHQKGIWLEGDNPNESVSSEQMGWVDLNQVCAKVLFSIKAKR